VQTFTIFCLVYFTALVVCHIRELLSPFNGWTECCPMKHATFVSESVNIVLQWAFGQWSWKVLQLQHKILKSWSWKLSRVSYIIKSLKEVMNPYMKNIYYVNFLALLRYGIILCGEDNKSNNIFKLQKRVNKIISGVSKHMSCREIFKDFNILTVASLAYWKWYVRLKSTKIHWSTLYTFITTILQKNVTTCVILQYRHLQGIILHNKVADHIKT